jgi:hypothetical protein
MPSLCKLVFKGEFYQRFVSFLINSSLEAEDIVVRKILNNLDHLFYSPKKKKKKKKKEKKRKEKGRNTYFGVVRKVEERFHFQALCGYDCKLENASNATINFIIILFEFI